MWPILLCSLFSLAIVINKFIYFSNISMDFNKLRDDVFEAIKNNDIKGAMGICDRHDCPVSEVLKAGLLKLDRPKDQMAFEMENVAQLAVAGIEARLSILSTIGQVAPLLGFLGTVSGMAATFYTINARAAAMNPLTASDIAGGIWQALITTMAGLLVAIPTLLAYRYFIDRRDGYVLEMERVATQMLNFSDHLRNDVTKE